MRSFVRVNAFECWTPAACAFEFVFDTWLASVPTSERLIRELTSGVRCFDLRPATPDVFVELVVAIEDSGPASRLRAGLHPAFHEQLEELLSTMRGDPRAASLDGPLTRRHSPSSDRF